MAALPPAASLELQTDPYEGEGRFLSVTHYRASGNVKTLVLLALLLSACASAPSSEVIDRPVFAGFTVDQVRNAVRIVLADVARSQSNVRIRDDRVLTEGRIGACERDVVCGGGTLYIQQNTGTPWARIEVRLLDHREGTAVEVDIEYSTSGYVHCRDGFDRVRCRPEQLSSTGFLERKIINGIRVQLEAEDDVLGLLSE